MERKTTSIKIDPELWKKLKIHCVTNSIDMSDWLEQTIRKALK